MSFPVVNGTEVLVAPPDGYQVNFSNPVFDTGTLNGHFWAFGVEFPIAVLFLAQRLYTSKFILRQFRIDDYMILLAWVFTTTAQCLILRCIAEGILGVHVWEISLDKAIHETTLIHATTLTVIPGTVLAKLVLCIFYYRLSPIPWYRYAIIAVGVVTIATFASVWFAVEFACKPIEAAWNLRLYTGTNCIDRPPVYMLQAIMGGITDIMLMLLPLPTVLGLHMSWKQKAGLVAWFGTGLLTLGAAIARLIVLLPALTSTDTTWVLAPGTMWLIVEANLIIICGSLPTFRVFLNHMSPMILGEARSTNKSSGGGKSGGDGSGNGMRYALRTFGSSQPKRRHFETIDELEHGAYGSDVTWKSGVESAGTTADTMMTAQGHRSEHSDEEAIVRTVSTTLEYSQR